MGAGEVDLPSACWGGLAGIAAGLGLGRVASRRGRAAADAPAGVDALAREQLQVLRRRHG